MPRGRRHYRVTLADAVEAHERSISQFGGRGGILSEDNLLSALGRPYSGYFRSIEEKAAALLEAIVRNHGFTDGNKRTAVLLVLLLLDRSGFNLPDLPDERTSRELEELVVGLAKNERSYGDALSWFRLHCRPRPPEEPGET